MSKILVIPDTQCKPNIPLDYCSWIGQYIVDKKPDVIVHLGDHFDMPSLSIYDKGKLAAEGRRIKDDVNAGIEGMNLILSPLKQLQAKQKKDKKGVYNPRLVYCLGNHCVEENTEVLTIDGWKLAKDITVEDHIATVDLSNREVEFANPSIVSKEPAKDAYSVVGDDIDELISSDHSIIFKGERKKVSELSGKYPKTNFMLSCRNDFHGEVVETTWLRLLTWVIADGCLVQGETANKKRVQFKLSKQRKIDRLESLLTTMGVPYTKTECKKTGINKLQPYYIRIYGDTAREIFRLLNGSKTIPLSWRFLNKEQADAVLEEYGHTDGHCKENRLGITTTNRQDAETLQLLAFFNGYAAKVSEFVKRSGFANGKKQCLVKITIGDNNAERRKVSVNSLNSKIDTIAITVKHSTIVTRRNGKMCVTGNCQRLQRISSEMPEFAGLIGYDQYKLQEYGWEVHDFLKPVEIEGIHFVHYLANPFSGKPYGGSALSMLKNIGNSFVMGHKQTLDIAVRPTLDGKMQLGIVAGACYDHQEEYKGYQGNNHYRGLIMLHGAKDGYADVCMVNLEYLKNKYEFYNDKKNDTRCSYK